MKNQVWDSYHNIKKIVYSDLNSSEKLVLISIATNCEFDTKSRNYISQTPLSTLIRNSTLDEKKFNIIFNNFIDSGIILPRDKKRFEFNFHSSLTPKK
ncbi:MAG: hypothetical protein CL764_02705 [Chloroflexi bacterium]|nr:hypothetical protein [Chloroflexota bacterium]|tara:strand:- start:2807 stop:3100 length:294 start_codon:yes stop_codon:yes gene_type:complete